MPPEGMVVGDNWIAIIVAAIAIYAVGFLIYGALFSKLWMQLSGYTKEQLAPHTWKMAVSPIMPILTAIGDSIGVLGGYVVSVYTLDFNGTGYLKNTVDFAHSEDITSGLIKAAVFGFVVALMGCYNGFNSKGGAQGVGNATTNAVVGSSIMILAADYVLTALLFHK